MYNLERITYNVSIYNAHYDIPEARKIKNLSKIFKIKGEFWHFTKANGNATNQREMR